MAKTYHGKFVCITFYALVKRRKAAQTFIKEEVNVNEGTIIKGINDVKYFSEHFSRNA